ncbi:MAG: CHAD domain-containing protein, partial [Chromatiales bacterium]
HCGISPANRKDSGVFGLKEHEPAEQAVREMSVAMLQQARRNEKGIVEDVDTEFLHQYRVNLRKTRSLLNLMKKALPEDLYARLKPALSELSGVTNDLRDLDVFLLQRDYYRKLLPDAFAVGLERLFKMIAADREKARAAVAKSLQAKRHEALYDEVLQLLGAGAEYTSQLAQKPIQQVANKKILARYHRICELGAQIDENTPDHEVHELRIEGKKLRYLMEFFAELYPSKRIKKLIKPLKQMQTILGDFNDYSVQQRFLADYEASHKKSAELSAAISGLVAVLHQKQIAERARVQEAFATFGGTELRNEFELMFGKVRQGNTP